MHKTGGPQQLKKKVAKKSAFVRFVLFCGRFFQLTLETCRKEAQKTQNWGTPTAKRKSS